MALGGVPVSRLFLAFLARGYAVQKRYFADYALGLLVKVFFFTAILYGSQGSTMRSTYVAGFLLWYFAAHLLARMANFFLEEAYLGTLARLLSSPHPPMAIVAALSLAELLVALPWVAALGVYAWWSGVSLSGLGLGALVAALLALLGVWGLGLALLAASLRYKQVGSFTEMLTFYFLLFSGFFVSWEKLPLLVRAINALNPLYQTVMALSGHAYWGLLASAAFWLLTGGLALAYSYRWALRAGRLLDY